MVRVVYKFTMEVFKFVDGTESICHSPASLQVY